MASFAEQKTAEAFAATYGGQVYRFDQIDLALISAMGF
ncbi:nitrous oxide reductase accessory protein NosL [Motiliproteus sp. SC1-56]